MYTITELKAKLYAILVRKVYDHIIESPDYGVADVLYFAENLDNYKDVIEIKLTEILNTPIIELFKEYDKPSFNLIIEPQIRAMVIPNTNEAIVGKPTSLNKPPTEQSKWIYSEDRLKELHKEIKTIMGRE